MPRVAARILQGYAVDQHAGKQARAHLCGQPANSTSKCPDYLD